MNDAAANPVTESAPNIGMGAEYPQLLEVTERLNENVAQLHRSVCLFMGQAWNKASSWDFLLLRTEPLVKPVLRRQRVAVLPCDVWTIAPRHAHECVIAGCLGIAVRRNHLAEYQIFQVSAWP